MALDLVEGRDLRAVLAGVRASGRPLSIEAVVYVAAEIAKALAYAHGRPTPVVHRDVAPANILVSFHGAVRLTDFGIAKVAHTQRTRTGQLKGKIPYMAPEQQHGDPVDARTDLWSLGVVMFQMLCGRRPFVGATDLATQVAVAEGTRPEVKALRIDAPAALVALIDHCLQVRSEARPASADDVLDALSEIPIPANIVRLLGALARLAPTRADDA